MTTIDNIMALHKKAAIAYSQAFYLVAHVSENQADEIYQSARETEKALRTALAEALAQPVREPLTDEQIYEVYIRTYNADNRGRSFRNAFASAIERAHHIGVKNEEN